MEGKMREKGRVKSIFSLLLVIVMVLGMMPAVAFAGSSSSADQVHVIVENTTYTIHPDTEDFWHGTLVDTWVDINTNSNAMDAIVAALDAENYTQERNENDYITKINGLGQFAGGPQSGWMGSINDWFANCTFSNCTVNNGLLAANDEIRVMYSCVGYGADLGADFMNANTTLSALTIVGGTLWETFDPDEHEYALYLVDEDTASIKITPTADNKNLFVGIYDNGVQYRRTASIPVYKNDRIELRVNESGITNNSYFGSTTYTLIVKNGKDRPRHSNSSNNTATTETTATQTTTAPVEVKAADGSKSTTTADANGVAKTEATVSAEAAQQAAKENKPVTLAMNAAEASTDAAKAPTVTVDLPAGTSKAKVEIPVKDVNNSTVAVLVKADGTEEVIAKTMVTENGIVAELSDGETIKIVDNHKDFNDVTNHWAKDDIDFITARNIFNGVGGGNFDANGDMTRGMLMTVLARYDGTNASGSEWKEKGAAWAKEKGVSDGTALDEKVTREQLVTMLWRYAGSPVATDAQTANFNDAAKVQDFAKAAMDWAVESGLIKGSDNNIDPDGNAQRGQLAAIMHRFMIMMEGK